MTIKVTKPAINIREALKEKFDTVPFIEKMPVGSVVQTVSYTSTTANGTSTTVMPSVSAGIILGYVHITPLLKGSAFVISAMWSHNFSRVDNFQCSRLWLGYEVSSGELEPLSNSGIEVVNYFHNYEGADAGDDNVYDHPSKTFTHAPSYTLGQTISYMQKLGAGRGSASVSYPTVGCRNSGVQNPASHMTIQEIVGIGAN